MPEFDSNEVSVKVAVRIRPLTNRERLHKHQPCIKISPESNQLVIGKDKTFTFDHVLPPKTTQSDLYETCVESLVKSIFEGYNATIFAYGQTGSGKTYTINGNSLQNEEVGIIPRAINEMFKIIKELSSKDVLVKVSYLEIYKEELKDLLDPSAKEMHIREDESGNITINGVNEMPCLTHDDVMTCFNSGSILRHTGSTNMNEQSSRSHSIFTVTVEQRWTTSDQSNKKLTESEDYYNGVVKDSSDVCYLGAKFHFVDLAGSERAGRTGNVGDRFKESIHINSGLLALGNVISALSTHDRKRNQHIPYRDSKITRILKDSLGGNAKTLMICCISPSSCNLDESLNALKYASRARYIRNKPVVNMDPQTQRFVEMQSEIKALRDELHRQRTQLVTAENHINQQQFYNQSEIKDMEVQIINMQTECDHYKNLIKDACSRFKEVSRLATADEQIAALVNNWFELVENSKQVVSYGSDDYAKQRIMELEAKFEKAQNDLKSDEEIFLEKEKEINELKERMQDLDSNLFAANRYLEASLAKEKEQQELMVQLQIQLDNLMQGKQDNWCNQRTNSEMEISKKSNEQVPNDLDDFKSPSILSSKTKNRAKTAPISQINKLKESRKNRNVFSSPALFPLDKVMQGFRARTQLLAETLEENDNVLQKEFERPDSTDYTEANNGNAFRRKGTYSIRKDEATLPSETFEQSVSKTRKTTENDPSKDQLNLLRQSTEVRHKVLEESESKLKDAYQKMKDLSLNIKMKEELIKELVANSKFSNRVNVEYQQRIESLQKDLNLARAELVDMQSLMQQVSVKDHVEKSKLENEYKKKFEIAQQKILELETKQKETIKLLNVTSNSDKRISELELTLTKMKQQHEVLQRKIKDENDKKAKVEKDLEKEQQRIKDLQSRNDQQQKILKKKTEDLAVAQRKLRSGSASGFTTNDDQPHNRHWIEQEIEKIMQEKRQLEIVKDELKRREDLCKKKELLIQEKNELQVKKLRSSQTVRDSLLAINQKLHDVDRQLQEANGLGTAHSKDALQLTYSGLIQQRKQLDERLANGCILTTSEERRLIEIEEAIEALEIAIQFENQSINEQESKLKMSSGVDISNSVLGRISEIPHDEAKHLVRKFFQKIIDLKQLDRRKQLVIDELQVQVDEKTRVMDELKRSVTSSSVDLERRLVLQQHQHDKQIRTLTDQLSDYTRKNMVLERELNACKDKLKKLNPNILDDLKMNDYETGDSVYANHSIVSQVKESTTSKGALHASEQLLKSLHGGLTGRSATHAARQAQNIVFKSNMTDNSTMVSSNSHVHICKDSLNDSTQLNNHDGAKQITVVKLSKKDLRPLTDADLMKRVQKQ